MTEDVNNTPQPRSERRKRAAVERITDDIELGVENTAENARRAINKINFTGLAAVGVLGGLVAGFFLGSALGRSVK